LNDSNFPGKASIPQREDLHVFWNGMLADSSKLSLCAAFIMTALSGIGSILGLTADLGVTNMMDAVLGGC
jgi:hypothetical protein